MPEAQSDATSLLNQIGEGNRAAADELLPMIHEELRRLARAQLRREGPGHTLQTTALIDDAFMRLIEQRSVAWQSRAHFYALAARTIRRILVDHARGRKAMKRGGAQPRISLDMADGFRGAPDVDLSALEEALQRLAALSERQAKVIELRFFGALSVEQAAEVLDVSTRTVEADWHLARAWLRCELE